MLLAAFKPRRLLALAIVVFVAAILVLQQSSYHNYLPKYDLGWSGTQGGESSLEQDQQAPQPPGRVEVPSSEDEFKAPRPPPRPATTPVRAGPAATSSPAASLTHSPSPSLPASSAPATGTSLSSPLSHESYESVQLRIQGLIKDWKPPQIGGHWPPYDGYAGADYDPNRWEGFEWDNDFYLNTGVKKVKGEKNVSPVPYAPYPAYNSPSWQGQWRGEYVPCQGARGKLLNESDDDVIKAFPVLPGGFPNVAIGDANATGIDLAHCFDRYNRFGAYGLGPDTGEAVDSWRPPTSKPDWSAVRWGQLQDLCLVANRERYAPSARQPVNLAPGKELPNEKEHEQAQQEKAATGQKKFHSRTALLIRTWEGYDYTENDLEAFRALITELSLLSGGEYQVFLFVNVKDKNADIFNNQQVYDDILKQSVPHEFHGISILWNERIFEEWYPKVGDWQVYWHQFMPLQWFSKTHPEFDYIWNWETDARYTGNHYHFMEAVANFSKAFPRKYMWERNQRFYFPAAHGSYAQWLADTDATIERGVREGTVTPVWGPQPYGPAKQSPTGPTPPTTMKDDQFQWGVGEEADLITLQPIWDPTHTEWSYRDKIWNYLPNIRPHFSAEDPLDEHFHHPEFATLPRRTYINTLSRFSTKLLHAMHIENMAGRATQAEMWPATVALQHGLKAVYAPHPIWTDRKWPAWYMDAIFNADAGQTAQWGQQADSVYNHDREHNFGGWSWYYQTEFPKSLYRRWLGWATKDGSPLSGIGGKSFEDGRAMASFENGDMPEVGGNGRMCLPPMLLHPVKKTREDAYDRN